MELGNVRSGDSSMVDQNKPGDIHDSSSRSPAFFVRQQILIKCRLKKSVKGTDDSHLVTLVYPLDD